MDWVFYPWSTKHLEIDDFDLMKQTWGDKDNTLFIIFPIAWGKREKTQDQALWEVD